MWEQARKPVGPNPPSSGGPGRQRPWLRARHETSKSYRLILPIVLRNLKHGEKEANIDLSLAGRYLDVDEAQAARLSSLFAPVKEVRRTPLPRVGIDKAKLAQEFQIMLDTGVAKNKADLARQKNVSRAWISTVLKHLPAPD